MVVQSLLLGLGGCGGTGEWTQDIVHFAIPGGAVRRVELIELLPTKDFIFYFGQ